MKNFLLFIMLLPGFLFSYMEIDFGISNTEIDTPVLEGNIAGSRFNFLGYTEQNLVYGVGYNYGITELSGYDFEFGTLAGNLGYAFSDLSTGSFYVGGALTSTSYSYDGVNVDEYFDTTGIFLDAGYLKKATEGINWGIGLTYDIDDCNDDCVSVGGHVDFDISDGWGIGLSYAYDDVSGTFSIYANYRFP